MADYLHHNFPVILHVAKPVRLNKDLEDKLNDFLPLYREILKSIILSKGRTLLKYRLFKPHNMAVILTPNKVVFALDTTNATVFLTGFYCFELPYDAEQIALEQILKNTFHLYDSYFFEFERELLDEDCLGRKTKIEQKASEYEETEYELIRKGEKVVDIKPKIFKNTDIPMKENYCFVLMPFDENLREIYEECIYIAVDNCGMVCDRADDIFHNDSIMEVIWTQICSAEIIIADLTGKNPNVFYEVGIAHTLGKEVILLTQSEEDVPFDLRHIKFIKYGMTKRNQEALINELEMTMKSIKGMLEGMDEHE